MHNNEDQEFLFALDNSYEHYIKTAEQHKIQEKVFNTVIKELSENPAFYTYYDVVFFTELTKYYRFHFNREANLSSSDLKYFIQHLGYKYHPEAILLGNKGTKDIYAPCTKGMGFDDIKDYLEKNKKIGKETREQLRLEAKELKGVIKALKGLGFIPSITHGIHIDFIIWYYKKYLNKEITHSKVRGLLCKLNYQQYKFGKMYKKRSPKLECFY